MKVTDYIAQRLAREGISKAFVVQGAANNDLIYSIADTKGIDYVAMMHEQAAGFAAEGWAKVAGRAGVAIGTSGPGGQNLVTPIANCYYDSVPCLFITGQVNSRFMTKGIGLRQVGFQEWPAAQVVAPITKMAHCITDPQLVPHYLEQALYLCKKGRPGPCLLDIPMDVQKAELDLEAAPSFAPPYTSDLFPHAAAIFKIKELVEDLKNAKRPIMLVGGGAREAEGDLLELICTLGIPACPTWNAVDIITDDFRLFAGRVGTYGGVGRNFAIQNCDLLIVVGSRLSGRITGGNLESFARAAKKYVVDIDPNLCLRKNQQVPFDVSIHCSVEFFTAEMLKQKPVVEGDTPSWTAWLRQVNDWKRKYDPAEAPWEAAEDEAKGPVHFYNFARELDMQADSDAIIVTDCGGNAVVMSHAFRTKYGQRFFSNHGNSPMGFAFCAAIGAALAAPGRQVICIIGDGGFGMNLQCAQLLVTLGLTNLKTFILDNRVYGITKAFQQTHYKGRFEASAAPSYVPPDYVAVLRAFGWGWKRINAQSISQNEKLTEGITDALAEVYQPVVCVVESPGFCTYEPKINGWNTPIEDMHPMLPRDEFRDNMLIEPLPGWETGEY